MNETNNTFVKRFARSGVGSSTSPLLFEHIVIMVFENRGYNHTLNSVTWQSIINSSALLTNMSAVTHPSQPNYVSMIAGSPLECKSDYYFSTNSSTIADLLNLGRVTWKTYQENYTSLLTTTTPNCNDAEELANGSYVRRHNPFMFSSIIRSNISECLKIVNADQLEIDLANNQLPQFVFYTPNMENNAHDTSLTYAGTYLNSWLNSHLNNPSFRNGTLLIVTFDEADADDYQTNHIPTLMWGPDYLFSGISISGSFNHYSLTKLIEENWGLGNLGREDVNATSLMDIWRPFSENNGSVPTNGVFISSVIITNSCSMFHNTFYILFALISTRII